MGDGKGAIGVEVVANWAKNVSGLVVAFSLVFEANGGGKNHAMAGVGISVWVAGNRRNIVFCISATYPMLIHAGIKDANTNIAKA
jgi:hypothetical protein